LNFYRRGPGLGFGNAMLSINGGAKRRPQHAVVG
jgi:hypothetical protein